MPVVALLENCPHLILGNGHLFLRCCVYVYVYAASFSVNLLKSRDGDPDIIVLAETQQLSLFFSQSDHGEILIADLEPFSERIEGRKQLFLDVCAYDTDISGMIFIILVDLSSPLKLQDRTDDMIEMSDASDFHIF
jgi:hypothetical protein